MQNEPNTIMVLSSLRKCRSDLFAELLDSIAGANKFIASTETKIKKITDLFEESNQSFDMGYAMGFEAGLNNSDQFSLMEVDDEPKHKYIVNEE